MSKTTTWVIVVIVAVVIVGWLWKNNGSGSIFNYAPTLTQPSSTNTGSNTPAKTTKTTTPSSTSATVASYSDLERQYSDLGQLIQFDDSCHARPDKMVIKSGAKIMLDNRSSIPKDITVSGVKYNLPAYHYQIIIAKTSQSLPANEGVSCWSASGSSQNASTLNIQALIGQ